jgi:glycosyltransferase involved in cell wall biosynthesis
MKIAFVHSGLPGFVKVDRDLLRRDHQVYSIDFKWRPRTIIATLRAVQVSDLVFAWFAGQHSFLAVTLAKALGNPIIVAAADYDLANEAWFNYGSMRGGIRSRINNIIFRSAGSVLVPSVFSRDLALRNTILRRSPGKVRMVPLGFDWTPPPGSSKMRSLITIGGLNPENWIRKGHREFVALCKRLDVPCYLVGKPSSRQFLDRVLRETGPNLQVTGYLPEAKLSELLRATQAYAQLSYMEGFGAAVAEAMLAGCVPVVTRQGSLPEVVGECGYYVDYGSEDEAHRAAVAALDDRGMGMRARERVMDCFPLRRRHEQIAATLEEVCGRRGGSEHLEGEILAAPNM